MFIHWARLMRVLCLLGSQHPESVVTSLELSNLD